MSQLKITLPAGITLDQVTVDFLTDEELTVTTTAPEAPVEPAVPETPDAPVSAPDPVTT